MKTNFLTLTLISIFSFAFMPDLFGQEVVVQDGYELVDSVVYRPAAPVDSTLVGKDIFHMIHSAATASGVEQSQLVEQSMREHIRANKERQLTGYRVRIFFDNKQTARNESEETLKRFQTLHKGVAAYRTYANPYFKVTVGDFRTKSEAMELLSRIRQDFPSAFVVKESISYPVVDKEHAVVSDTVKVLRAK